MKMKSLVCSCAVIVGLSGLAQAHENVDNDGKFSVLFGGGKYFTDSDRNLDDGSVGEIGLGYNINKHWTIEAIYSDISGVDADGTGANVDADMYRLDALYNFNQSGHWTPYLAAGVGELNFDTKGGSDSDETALNLGGGVKYALSNAFSVRGDVRAVHGTDDSKTDALATIGFNYVFGAGSAAVAEVAAEPLDSDGDGVPDADDRCPGTPAGVSVDAMGCALDSDQDGVPNHLDKCPDTKADVRVDSDGCAMMTSDTARIDLEVLFDTNQAVVKPEFRTQVERVADFMKRYPEVNALIEGHTDSMGEAAYNKGLSLRRADAVRDVLVKELDIELERITAEGYGEERPRASNETREGRQLNRRVVAELTAEVESEVKK